MNESQVLDHIRALDRVPDPAVLELPPVSSTAFLERQRRHPMTVSVQQPRPTRWRAVFVGAIVAVVVAVGVAAWLAGDGESDVASTPREIVERHAELRWGGQTDAALALFSAALADKERSFYEVLAELNTSGQQTGPCEETVPGRFVCPMIENNDYLEAAGFSMTGRFIFAVSDELLITTFEPSVNEYPTIFAFDTRYRDWMAEAYPQDEARMEGSFSGGDLTLEGARIALQHVEEFLAQSDLYPLNQ